MKHSMSHKPFESKLSLLAGLLFCFLLSLECGMAQSQPERLRKFDVPKGRWNLLLINNIIYNQWNYLPSHQLWDHSYMGILGAGAGFEYAYCRNQTLSLTVEAGFTGLGLTMEPPEFQRNTVYYNINLLHTFYWKHFAMSIGPTLGWNEWKYFHEEGYFPESENGEGVDDYYGEDNFSFTRFAAGADVQVYYYIIPRLGFGAEYSVRWMWKDEAKGKCDQQWALKAQFKFKLSKKKRHY